MKYKVVGGQRDDVVYGVFDKLEDAIEAAEENVEYWQFIDESDVPTIPWIWECDDDGEELDCVPKYIKQDGRWWDNDKFPREPLEM